MELNTIPTYFFNMDELVADYLIEGQSNLDKLREVVSTDVLSLIMNTPTGFGNEMQDTFFLALLLMAFFLSSLPSICALIQVPYLFINGVSFGS